MSASFIKKLRFNENGLIPAIAQDWLDGAVLMMAWMNQESFEKTLQTGEAHYWSRSRDKLWKKGETSGNLQIVKGIRYDCDSDTVLLTIEQIGLGACHTGSKSCFYKDPKNSSQSNEIFVDPPTDACSELFKTIQSRSKSPVAKSYTNTLLAGGDNLILKKIGEEAAEFVMACKDNQASSISNEAADLIYHLQVALEYHQVDWKEVLKVLANRRAEK